jgi:aspartyl-tRNA(Asn)/glutamyl-tRNA(Gln) amidotransferase subunit A
LSLFYDHLRRKMKRASPLASAAQLVRDIRSKAMSPTHAVEAAISVIERHNPRLLAFCTLTLEQARAHAREIERKLAAGEDAGPLAGVPLGIKDLILTCGTRTTGGCIGYADYVPEEDDVVVERLRAAGAILLGKTNVSELGYSLTGDNPLFGITRNPWNPELSSGGSSAGAAVAVATGMGPVAIGSDGGGSIRLPAAFCGVFGFKPSMGRVPLYPGCRDERLPGLSSWESLEHIGPLTRTVEDAALVMSVISGADPRDRHSIPSEASGWHDLLTRGIAGRRVAYCPTWDGVVVDPEIRVQVEAAAKVFADDLGCIVEEVAPIWDKLVLNFRTLMAAESDLPGMRAMAARLGERMSPNLRRFLQVEWTAEMFTDANKFRKSIANQMWRLMARYDYLLTPTTSDLPPPADKPEGEDDIVRPVPSFTCIANMTGQPAASLPAGWTASGLPIGVQIIGRHLADRDVITAAAAFEKARPWQNRWPSL